ncbi:hypothetical protein CWI38_2561p0010 [Hamiltosporidium tvaerminnensis]|uniref:Uncharacterized protein n=1 Tax=Hamiltosporidium tvaerminnensis TaxID=1176355 RepID=A0A4Q9LET7_9MICR|nr:hypothetical protein CWI38_2561p0010 [Hamiltosporidium tvaerminnensis]
MGGYKQFENKGGILEITRDTNDMGGIMDDTYNNTRAVAPISSSNLKFKMY